MKKNCAMTILGSAALTAFTPAAHAQLATGDDLASGGDIVVTALKRSESVQSTPATVSLISAEMLANSNVATLEQLGTVLPGVIIQRPPNNTANATIRGIGTSPGPVAFDQGVALFVDGVYAARGADFLSSLFDVERIEVVKGTQAAVLGKNTSLGAIALTSRKPGKDFGGDFTASYEFVNNSTQISGGVDIPAGETLSIRVAGQYQDLSGFSRNRIRQTPAENTARQTRDYAGRITAVWNPGSSVGATVSYAHDDLRNTGIPYEFIVSSPAVVNAFTAGGYPGALETNLDFNYANYNAKGPSRLRQKSDRVNATLDIDAGVGTITSITGWSKFRQNRYTDYDYSPADFIDDYATIVGEQFSQEIRLASDGSAAFQYLVGALYLHNKLKQDLLQDTHFTPGMNGAYHSFFDQKTDTWSAFAQPQYEFENGLKLIGGIRVTHEKKSVDMERITVRPGPFTTVVYPPYPRTLMDRSETVLDGSVTAQYAVTDHMMVYASWGQGSKGGGYSDVGTAADAEYRKEVARSFEAGVKVEGDDRNWHVNVAVFDTKVKDFQNNLFNGTKFITENLDILSTGAELEALWRPTPGLNLTVEGTYARTRNLDQAAGLDNRMPRSPRLAGKVGMDYRGSLTNALELHAGIDLTYRSRISHQLNPKAVPFGKSYPSWNGIIGIADEGTGLELSLIGRNLTKSRSTSFAFPAPFMTGGVLAAPEDGRSVAVQLRFNM